MEKCTNVHLLTSTDIDLCGCIFKSLRFTSLWRGPGLNSLQVVYVAQKSMQVKPNDNLLFCYTISWTNF